jgi:hypothetical protein
VLAQGVANGCWGRGSILEFSFNSKIYVHILRSIGILIILNAENMLRNPVRAFFKAIFENKIFIYKSLIIYFLYTSSNLCTSQCSCVPLNPSS